MLDLSIVLPTCSRGELLNRCLEAIQAGTRCRFEVIAVDGASSDHTPEVLQRWQQWMGDRLRVIREPRREGFVRAANKGFAVATGRNVAWLNDDARPLAGALDLAVQQMDQATDDVAMLAMFHRWYSLKNIAYQINHERKWYCLLHVHGSLYASFGIGKRQTLENLGYFDERYYMDAADADLSLKAWHAGLRIAPAYCAIIDHEEIHDARRSEDAARAEEDSHKLQAKWDLPPKNPHRNDFDPANPCTLRGLHQTGTTAAA